MTVSDLIMVLAIIRINNIIMTRIHFVDQYNMLNQMRYKK